MSQTSDSAGERFALMDENARLRRALADAVGPRCPRCERAREACDLAMPDLLRLVGEYPEDRLGEVVDLVRVVQDATEPHAADAGEPACPCPPRHYTPDELGHDLGELERQIQCETPPDSR